MRDHEGRASRECGYMEGRVMSVEQSVCQGMYEIADAIHARLQRHGKMITGDGSVSVVYENLFDLKLKFQMGIRSAGITPVGDVVVLVTLMGNLGMFVGYDANDGDLVLALLDRAKNKPTKKISMRNIFEGKRITSVHSAFVRVYKTFKVVRVYMKPFGADQWSDLGSDWRNDAEAVGA